MTHGVTALTADKLRRRCDTAVFDFESTAELSALDEIIGQDRAVRAVSFGIDIGSPGYHMYALGPAGTGKTTTIREFLERKAADQPVPDDWLYVNNFDDPDRPRALRLPAGLGCGLEAGMEQLVEELQTGVPAAFESEDYQQAQEEIREDFQQRRQELFQNLEKAAKSRDFTLVQTQQGLMMAPVIDGNVVTPEQLGQLDEEKREKLETRQEELQSEMRQTMRHIQQLQQEARERVRELDQRMVGMTVEHLINALKEEYAEFDQVVEFLEAVQRDLMENVQAFKQAKQMEEMEQQMPLALLRGQRSVTFDKYRANLIVDNCDTAGAPVVLASNPAHANLIGRVEHEAQFGALITSFCNIKAGALHEANGGYLMVEARSILTKPFAWDALKRALKNEEVRIESIGEEWRVISTRSLEPEPIPLDIKVVMVGDPLLYYLLYNADEDFQELFKVKADFAVQTDWDDETPQQYARFIGSICNAEGLHHFAPSGVARVVERAARMVGDQEKVATKFGEIVDLVRESSYWAGENGNDLVEAADVERAIDEKEHRSNKLEERLLEMIKDGTILIDTDGEVVGQVNGLSVLPLGDYSFGKPTRITARTHVGSEGVVDIERETDLGGRIHSKGVLILAGYLGGKFAEEVPLALSATIAFEQSYGEVEGDSASSAELYGLLSSLSELPIKQNLAITGSVNQRGQVQAIGGVNEKVEGFFDVCQLRGLTGDQGVLIPAANVKNLMLRDDVVEAVEKGKFHVHPVETIDEGIEILTGVPAGERQADGTFPEGTVNRAVEDALRELAAKGREFMKQDEESDE